MSTIRRTIVAAVLLAACFGFAGAAQACPGCAEAQAGQGPGRANIVRGYQLSIIFMMSMPFLIVGSFGGYVYYTVRKARAENEAAADADRTDDGAAPPLA